MRKRRKLLFIVNPQSGKGQIKGKILNIIDIFVKEGWEPTVYTTQKAGDAKELVEAKIEKYELVVCSGGDGTMDETVNGMMNRETRVPIGYIPAGTANDFATSLHIPKNMERAAEIAVTGRPFSCDIGRLNQRHFVYIAAFGMFTGVSYGTPQEWKNMLGHAAYILEGAMNLQNMKPYKMVVECNGERLEGEFIYGMVTNSISVGGFPNMSGKNVKLDDGLYELTLIRMPKNPMELSAILASMSNLIRDTELIYSVKTDSVRFLSKEPVAWTLDGEFGGEYTEAVVENLSKELDIMIAKPRKKALSKINILSETALPFLN